MVRHAPIHRRSGHSDIAICCGRNVRGSSPSTSVVPLSNQVTTLNHKRFKRFKMFSDGHLAPHHCWLTNKIKAPAAINRASRIPATSETTQCRLGSTSFDPFCAAPRPNQKRSLSIAVSAVIGAALWQCTYDYVELSHSASAKSPNPGQGCLARRHHER